MSEELYIKELIEKLGYNEDYIVLLDYDKRGNFYVFKAGYDFESQLRLPEEFTIYSIPNNFKWNTKLEQKIIDEIIEDAANNAFHISKENENLIFINSKVMIDEIEKRINAWKKSLMSQSGWRKY
jgi:hypothetical protein